MLGEQFLWTEKYRPHTVADTILPTTLKKTFQQFVDQKNIPNLLLYGLSGTGKTTVARAMLEELGCDYIVINGSLSGNIDTLRNEIQQFASSVSLQGGRKYVILDEADYLNNQSTMPALRNFMEEFSKNCGFILTCNFLNRIIPALQSRCSLIEFKISKEERNPIAILFWHHIMKILEQEKVVYDKKVLAILVQKFLPDWRRLLNELQKFSAIGKIDETVLALISEELYKQLVAFLKVKDFNGMRKWVGEHSDVESNVLYRRLFDSASTFLTDQTVPDMILILAKYQYQSSFVADSEINNVACLTEIMSMCKFKE